MFVQVITAQTTDPAGVRRRFDEWVTDLRPGAVGFLGSTAGVAADGRFIAVARFADEAAAQANSELPEQAAWWTGTEALLSGAATFRGTSDVEVHAKGGSDDAGFVQILEGTTTDRAEQTAIDAELQESFMAERPDFLGSLLLWWEGGQWLEVVYFSSEADARAGEAKGGSPEGEALFARWQDVAKPESFLDLTDPWLLS